MNATVRGRVPSRTPVAPRFMSPGIDFAHALRSAASV